MAIKEIFIAGLGPFEYDDTEEEYAVKTDGKTNIGNIDLLSVLQFGDVDISLLENDLDIETTIVTLDFG